MLRTSSRSINLLARSIPKRYLLVFFFFCPDIKLIILNTTRTFTQSAIARNAVGLPTSLQAFTEEEMMLREVGM